MIRYRYITIEESIGGRGRHEIAEIEGIRDTPNHPTWYWGRCRVHTCTWATHTHSLALSTEQLELHLDTQH